MSDKKEKQTEKNPGLIKIQIKWLFFVAILIAIIILVFVFWNYGFKALTGKVSESEARLKLINFFEEQIPGNNITILSSSKTGNFYEFVVDMEGEQFPLYITSDGEFLITGMIPLNQSEG